MAEKITINVPHKLSREQARERIDTGFGKVQDQLGALSGNVTQEWEGDTMHFTGSAMGQTLTGDLMVLDDHVKIEVTLPWFLAKLSGMWEEKLTKGTTHFCWIRSDTLFLSKRYPPRPSGLSWPKSPIERLAHCEFLVRSEIPATRDRDDDS